VEHAISFELKKKRKKKRALFLFALLSFGLYFSGLRRGTNHAMGSVEDFALKRVSLMAVSKSKKCTEHDDDRDYVTFFGSRKNLLKPNADDTFF
jgi:hypothetical protein